jgi:GlpG protein
MERMLLYDYPYYFELRDELLKIYTPKEIEQKEPPSKEADQLIQKIKKTPTWMGIYDSIVFYFRGEKIPLTYQGTLFEKIRQGEIWRLVTPAMLHLDLLHIFFNLLWFVLLGNQIEFRIGFFRYLLFMIVVAITSNTAQYLMSGPFFMGLSGIVCGMAGFIWARQQKAPWEGYLLNRFTLVFLGLFVIGMFAIQVVFFILQLLGKLNFPFGIANTAHLIGALTGYLLGRLRFFSIRPI